VPLRRQLEDQVGRVTDAARTMEAALRDAAEMVSQPIKVPKLWERIRAKFELALAIVGGVLALASSIFDGPVGFALGAAAFAAAAGSFGLAADDVAHHRAKWPALLLAAAGFLGPWARGIFSMAALGAGARAVVEEAGAAWRVLRSPAQWAGFAWRAGTAVVRGAAGLLRSAGRGLLWLPGGLWRGGLALPSALRALPSVVRGAWQGASGAVAEDFAAVMARYPKAAGVFGALGSVGRAGLYVGVNLVRGAAALVTPLRFGDMVELGFGGAWREVWEGASWSKGWAELRAGWAGYRRLGDAAKGLTKGLVAVGAHELGGLGWHGGDAGLHEPELAPVLVGMRWDKMLAALEKMPEERFQALIGQASGIVQSAMALVPVLGRDVTAQALRAEVFAPVVAVAYTLEKHGPVAAQQLAGALAKDLGAAPLHGLAGGMPPVREMVPGESSGRASGPRVRALEPAQTGAAPSLGAMLRKLRQQAGFTQVQLGERVGKSGSWISHIEMDRHIPRPGNLESVLRALSASENISEEVSARLAHLYAPADVEWQLTEAGLMPLNVERRLTNEGLMPSVRSDEGWMVPFDTLGPVPLPTQQLAAHQPAVAPVPRDVETGPRWQAGVQAAEWEEVRTRLLVLTEIKNKTATAFPPELMARMSVAGNSFEGARRLAELVVPVPLVPVDGMPLDALRGVRVWEVRLPGVGSGVPWRREVLGASDMRVAPLEGALVGELGDGFTLVSESAGGRFHVRAEGDDSGRRGRVVYVDWQLPGVGTLRVLLEDRAAVPQLLDAVGEWAGSSAPRRLGEGMVQLTDMAGRQLFLVDPHIGHVAKQFIPMNAPNTPVDKGWSLDFEMRRAEWKTKKKSQPGVGQRSYAGIVLSDDGALQLEGADRQIVLRIPAMDAVRRALTPAEGVPVMWLRGVPWLENAVVMRVPAVPGSPGSLRLWLHFPIAPPTEQWWEMSEIPVDFRDGGGVSVLVGVEGTFHFEFDGSFFFRTVRIRGRELALQFSSPEGTGPEVRIDVVGPDDVPVADPPGVVRHEHGLMLSMPVPGVEGREWAFWHYDTTGTPSGFSMPLLGEGVPPGLSIGVMEGCAGEGTRYFVLAEGSGAGVEGFTVGPVVGELAGELPEGFTVAETASGRVWHFPAVGVARYVDEPGADRRLLGSVPARVPAVEVPAVAVTPASVAVPVLHAGTSALEEVREAGREAGREVADAVGTALGERREVPQHQPPVAPVMPVVTAADEHLMEVAERSLPEPVPSEGHAELIGHAEPIPGPGLRPEEPAAVQQSVSPVLQPPMEVGFFRPSDQSIQELLGMVTAYVQPEAEHVGGSASMEIADQEPLSSAAPPFSSGGEISGIPVTRQSTSLSVGPTGKALRESVGDRSERMSVFAAPGGLHLPSGFADSPYETDRSMIPPLSRGDDFSPPPPPHGAHEPHGELPETVSSERNALSHASLTGNSGQALAVAQGRLRILLRSHRLDCPETETWSRLGVELGTVADYVVRGTQRPHSDLIGLLEELVGGTQVAVEPRADGRFVVKLGEGERLHLAGDGRLDFQLLRLPGSNWWLRFDHERSGPRPVRFVGRGGEPIVGMHAADIIPGGTHEVTVSLLLPGTRERAEWHIDWAHVLSSRTVPVISPDGEVPRGLRVRIDYSYQPMTADQVPHSYLVTDGSDREVEGFTAESLPQEFAVADPEGFALIQTAASRVRVFHLDSLGRDLVGSPVVVRETAPLNPRNIGDTDASSHLGPRIPPFQDSWPSGSDAQVEADSGRSDLRETTVQGLSSRIWEPPSSTTSFMSPDGRRTRRRLE
jgi:transcriptional regulator with XRE-family HTH domain